MLPADRQTRRSRQLQSMQFRCDGDLQQNEQRVWIPAYGRILPAFRMKHLQTLARLECWKSDAMSWREFLDSHQDKFICVFVSIPLQYWEAWQRSEGVGGRGGDWPRSSPDLDPKAASLSSHLGAHNANPQNAHPLQLPSRPPALPEAAIPLRKPGDGWSAITNPSS